MGRKSKIEAHPQSEEIIRRLASGEEYSKIVEDYPDIRYQDLYYYAQNKLPAILSKSNDLKALADEIGVAVTRLNAMLLAGALGEAACPLIAESQAEAMAYGAGEKIVLMGGVTPAQTTDAVAAVLAERCGADLMVNLTSVDGIYTADPRTDPAAERLDQLTPERLLEIVGTGSLRAGANTVIDMIAAKVIQRSGIPLLVIDGRDPGNLSRALLSGTYSGSLVTRGGGRPLPVTGS